MVIQPLLDKRAEYELERKVLESKIEAMDEAIAAMREAVAGPADRPKRGEAKSMILKLLEEAAYSGTDADKIVEVARLRGLSLVRTSVSSLLSRLKKEGIVFLDEKTKTYKLEQFKPKIPENVVSMPPVPPYMEGNKF